MSNLNLFTLFVIDQTIIIRKAMVKIIKLQVKQTINSALYHYNGLNMTLVYDFLFNSKVFI
jgi:hypothetical protein